MNKLKSATLVALVRGSEMNRRAVCNVFAASLFALMNASRAQSSRALLVAWVSPERAGSLSPNLIAFRAGMRELGYVEGANLVIDKWWGEGSADRIEQMAGDIVRSRPDVIVTASGLAILPLMRAGVKLPIVFVMSADPVEAKVVASYAHPGGNLTGMSLFSLNLMGKRLEFLKEAMPRLKRLAIIGNPEHSGEQLELKAAQEAAASLGFLSRYFPIRSQIELEQALGAIALGGDEAILAFADGFTMSFAEQIAAFSVAHRVPAVSGWAIFARRGNLLSYGPITDEPYRHLAVYVDKIFKGARPADLPVELPTKVELIINLKNAGVLGLTIPQSLLLRADEVIQ